MIPIKSGTIPFWILRVESVNGFWFINLAYLPISADKRDIKDLLHAVEMLKISAILLASVEFCNIGPNVATILQ